MSPLTTDDDFFPLAVLLLILLLSFLTILAAKKGFPVPKMGIFERKKGRKGGGSVSLFISLPIALGEGGRGKGTVVSFKATKKGENEIYMGSNAKQRP